MDQYQTISITSPRNLWDEECILLVMIQKKIKQIIDLSKTHGQDVIIIFYFRNLWFSWVYIFRNQKWCICSRCFSTEWKKDNIAAAKKSNDQLLRNYYPTFCLLKWGGTLENSIYNMMMWCLNCVLKQFDLL